MQRCFAEPGPTAAAWTLEQQRSTPKGGAPRSIRGTQSDALILLGPCARDDLGGALVEQLEANGTAEFARPVRRAVS